MEILIEILFSIVGILLIIWGFTRNEKPADLIVFGFMTSIVSAMLLGISLMELDGIISKKPIKPTLKIECTDDKCDTIYIYKVKK